MQEEMMSDSGVCPVAVLIVCFNGREHLEECLTSVLASEDGDLVLHVVMVDNASCDGSREFVRERFPRVELIESASNLGFAGGNNLGWETIRQRHPDVRFLVLLNQDTRVASGWLRPLVEFIHRHPRVGAVQSKLMLHADPTRINTLGNRSHFLGFGFMTGYGEVDSASSNEAVPITYASGAAVMFRAELLDRVGLFDDVFFAYLEDAEICWKLRQIGYETFLMPQSVVYHKYAPSAPFRHYYRLERNRYLLLFTYYKLCTLLLLAPALALMEAGQWLFSLRHGLLRERGRVLLYFLRPVNLRHLWHARTAAQARRRISDRKFLRDFSGQLQFEAIDNPLLRYIGNPLLGAYWFIARQLIFW